MQRNLSDNLNMLMAKARLSSSELARITGLPATTIKRIRTSEQSNPTILTLLPIAKHFSVTINELLGSDLSELSNIEFGEQRGVKSIPLLSWKECTQYSLLDYSTQKNKVLTEKQVTDRAYSLRVEDHGLEFFPANCLLIVEPNKNPEPGDYVIVAKSEQGIASIKKYIIETDQIYLKSIINGLGITPLTTEYKILGVIIQYKVELDRIELGP